jgi:hypothetical protein
MSGRHCRIRYETKVGGVVKKSLFVTVLMTILCGVLWIFFLAATHQAAVPEISAPAPAIAAQR